MSINTRNTIQKQIIHEEFNKFNNHPTAEMVYNKVHENYPLISKATVYRTLNQLSDECSIQRVHVIGAADRYDFNISKHYHGICNCCQNVFDINYPEIDELNHISRDVDGFIISEINVCFIGICPKCIEKEKIR